MRGRIAGRTGAALVAGREAWAGHGAWGVDGSRDVQCDASHEARGAGGSWGAARVARGVIFPRRMSRPPSVSGVSGRRSRHGGGFERRGRSTLHRRTISRQEKGMAGGGGHPRCTDGTLPPEGLGAERGEGGDTGYPSTLHRRVSSSHQESRERRLSPRRRLRKTGSCSSLNSHKEPIPTQSPPSAARKIPRGTARVCWRGARGQRRLANRICESWGRRAARACASAGPYSGP
jgi:hypothetical protein